MISATGKVQKENPKPTAAKSWLTRRSQWVDATPSRSPICRCFNG